jgi:hypothetical protein
MPLSSGLSGPRIKNLLGMLDTVEEDTVIPEDF